MNCSIYGKKYEMQVFNVVKQCTMIFGEHHIKFNTQLEIELGGCSHKNDIECNMNAEKDVPIEIKKYLTPDWMQCSLKYDTVNKKWIGSSKNKIHDSSKQIFEQLIENIQLFNGKIPPFISSKITHEEWLQIKKETTDFHDAYFNCPNDTIQRLYSEKGCKYIQISKKGLYHLGKDICEFEVPEFILPQKLRIRTKIHEKKDSNGFCKLSVIISCKPKNIKDLPSSNYSLDNNTSLPTNLIYTF